MCYTSSQQQAINYHMKKGIGGHRFKEIKNVKPLLRVNAFSNPYIMVTPTDQPDVITEGIWGLVPFWGKKDPKKFLSEKQYTNNARGEDLYKTKSYKGEVDEHRCIIYFDGFYEPHHYNKKEYQPYFCYISDNGYQKRELLSIAGIYSKVDDEYYISLVTTEANKFFAEIHNNKKRMPLVLDENLKKEWIAEGQSQSVISDIVNEGFTSREFKAHPVTNKLYAKKDPIDPESEENIKPVEPIEELNLF